MRGPMVRIQYDARRLWRCPKCQYERRAHADQTAIRCHCESKGREKEGPFMQLVEEQRKVRVEPEELPPYFEFEEEEGSKAPAKETTPESNSPSPEEISSNPEQPTDSSTLDPHP